MSTADHAVTRAKLESAGWTREQIQQFSQGVPARELVPGFHARTLGEVNDWAARNQAPQLKRRQCGPTPRSGASSVNPKVLVTIPCVPMPVRYWGFADIRRTEESAEFVEFVAAS